MFNAAGQLHQRPYVASLTVPSRAESIRPAASFIIEAARSLHVALVSEPLFEVAIVEALTNAFKHGNRDVADASILCELELMDRSFVVRVLDEGSGFVLSPQAALPEWTAADIAAIPATGYGMHVIQEVFAIVRSIAREGRFGLEMELRF
jgi:anti-sigma regulatory factor (Ser/Thr protein kinase)